MAGTIIHTWLNGKIPIDLLTNPGLADPGLLQARYQVSKCITEVESFEDVAPDENKAA